MLAHPLCALATALMLSIGMVACGGESTPSPSGASPKPGAAATPTPSPAANNPAKNPANCTELTYSTSNTSGPHANGDKVCFAVDAATMEFMGKKLQSPIQNTAVSAPFSAYAFADGANTYEVVFNVDALYEINVSASNQFHGQFAP
jgi:hypothetical protein